MSYEAHIAGVGDRPPGRPLMGAAIRTMQRAAGRELAARRGAVVEAVRAVAPLRFVNGGGTGSVERTAAEPAVTEVAAGSGLYGPTLFDAYTRFSPQPAALFALPVVRRPDARTATALGGGYPASGAAGRRPPPVTPPAAGPAARQAGGRGRGPDAAARPGRRGAACRRHGVDAPRQGGRAVRAVRLAVPGARGRGGGRGADVSRGRRVLPIGRANVNCVWVGGGCEVPRRPRMSPRGRYATSRRHSSPRPPPTQPPLTFAGAQAGCQRSRDRTSTSAATSPATPSAAAISRISLRPEAKAAS